MLFLYELFLKVLSKLKLGHLFYPLLRRINRLLFISLPNINGAKKIISHNTVNKSVKDRTFNFTHISHINNDNYDVQIVIPVYNSERYIRQCLNSVLHQNTEYKYQIIVVNDGSTDNTNKILRDYSNNPLIKIINENNYGLSVARNTGLRYVNSKYVMFVDSDDMLTSNAIQNLLSKAYKTNADITLGGSCRLFNNDNTKIWFSYTDCDRIHLKISNDIDDSAWGKVYKSSLFRNIYFPVGYIFEDMMLSFLIYPQCNKISSISSIVYFYRDNPSSITHRFKFNNSSVDSFLLLSFMIKSLHEHNIRVDQYVYNTFLDQVHATGMRNIYVNTKIQKSIFVLICCLYNKYFKHFSTDIIHNIQLERSLKNRDYMNYILFCIME